MYGTKTLVIVCVSACVCKPSSTPMLFVIIPETSHQHSQLRQHDSAPRGALKPQTATFCRTHPMHVLHIDIHYDTFTRKIILALSCSQFSCYKHHFYTIENIWINVKYNPNVLRLLRDCCISIRSSLVPL